MLAGGNGGPEGDNRIPLRIAALGVFAVVLFAILFFRLWSLQIVNGDEYLAEANSNRTRELRVTAPRGRILDRDGEVLVENRTSLAIQVNPTRLPADRDRRRAELRRLAQLTHNSLGRILTLIAEGKEEAPGTPVTIRRDVGRHVVFYLRENQAQFPGVSVERVFVRDYPGERLAAHILGNVGEVNEEELAKSRYRGLEAGDEVGKDGVEYSYDRFLRGDPGVTRIQVDASGQPTPGGRLFSTPPEPGDNVRLTIDADLQKAGESALTATGLNSAFVTMDVHSGEILGLGSYPNFDPTVFTRTMTQAEVDALYRDEESAPMTNRATTALYPVGSTFKIITALAALESGEIGINEPINDPGSIVIGDQKFENAGGQGWGSVSLVRAMQVSSDVYFYTLGARMWDDDRLQNWSHRLGIGRPTGLDIPGSATGLVPSAEWRDQLYEEGLTDRPWSIGDNVQLAIGQGDLQTNPLQMAIAYAMLGNGGTAVTPHVALQVDDPRGRVKHEFEPGPRRSVRIDPRYRRAILAGLNDAAQAPEGTSYEVFGNFPVPIAGKTGTAERVGREDQAWYVALAPYPNPRIVTAVTVEQGGFGAQAAAPVALKILEEYFHKQSSGPAGPNGGSPG